MPGDTDVFRVYSKLRVPRTDLEAFVESDVTLPAGIERIDIKKVNGQLQLQSVAVDDSLSRYTPTAMLKGGLDSKHVVVDEGELTHQTPSEFQQQTAWRTAEEDDLETKNVEYVHLYGADDDVLVHEQLRGAMFEVFCQLAEPATYGYVEGIKYVDDGLQPVRFDAGGDETDVKLRIEKTSVANTDSNGDDESIPAGNTGSTRSWSDLK